MKQKLLTDQYSNMNIEKCVTVIIFPFSLPSPDKTGMVVPGVGGAVGGGGGGSGGGGGGVYAWIEEQRERLEEDLGLDLFLKGELMVDFVILLFYLTLSCLLLLLTKSSLLAQFFPRSTSMMFKHTLCNLPPSLPRT